MEDILKYGIGIGAIWMLYTKYMYKALAAQQSAKALEPVTSQGNMIILPRIPGRISLKDSSLSSLKPGEVTANV